MCAVFVFSVCITACTHFDLIPICGTMHVEVFHALIYQWEALNYRPSGSAFCSRPGVCVHICFYVKMFSFNWNHSLCIWKILIMIITAGGWGLDNCEENTMFDISIHRFRLFCKFSDIDRLWLIVFLDSIASQSMTSVLMSACVLH